MAKRSLGAQVNARWREFRREPSAFFFVLFMPLVWMLLLGFAFSGSQKETVGVGWPKGGDERVHDALARSESIRLVEGTEEELTTALQRGDVLVIVDMGEKGVTYVYDPANKESRRARWVANDVIQQAGGRADPVITMDEVAAIPGTRYIDFLVPGLLALSLMSTSIWGTGLTIVAARRENLLKRYLATPMQPYEYILSHIVARFLIMVVEIAVVLVAARLIFNFRVAGRMTDFLALAVLGTAGLTALGLLLGARTANTGLMNGLANLISLPMMILGGAWFSRANFPEWLATAARFLPLTPLIDGLRRVALEGVGLAQLGPELGVLAFYFVVCTVAARLTFKWY